MLVQLASRQLLLAFALAAASLLLLHLPLPPLLPPPVLRPLLLVPNALAACGLLRHFRHAARDEYARRLWHAERVRGARAGRDGDGDGAVGPRERTRESAEWANALLAGVWPIVNTDLFAAATDMLEDIMQASAPSFVVRPPPCVRPPSTAFSRVC